MAEQQEHTPNPMVPEELDAFLTWWKAHGNKLLIVACLLLAVTMGWNYYQKSARTKEAVASQRLSESRTATDLEALLGEPGTATIKPLAQLKLAKAYFDAAQYALAGETYDALLAASPEHPMADVARVGKAHVLEAETQFEDALAAFEAFLSSVKAGEEHYLTPEATFGKARCLGSLGRKAEALALLDTFVLTHEDTMWAASAENLKGVIERRAGKPIASAPSLLEQLTTIMPEPMPEAAPVAPVATNAVAP